MAPETLKTARSEKSELADIISQIEFLTSAAKPADLPEIGAGEIAVAGRSNAGKSSALNTICNRRRLAFSSKTPGRTQLINFFTLRRHEEEIGRLVDLPGYGYASVDHATKRRWQAQLEHFLDSRVSLVGLILVMDARHPFGPLDNAMLSWFGRRRQPIHILMTKADKLTRNDQAKALAQAHRLIAAHGNEWGGSVSASLFSSLAKSGKEEVLGRISQWWGLVQNDDAKKNPARDSPGGNA